MLATAEAIRRQSSHHFSSTSGTCTTAPGSSGGASSSLYTLPLGNVTVAARILARRSGPRAPPAPAAPHDGPPEVGVRPPPAGLHDDVLDPVARSQLNPRHERLPADG